MRPSPVLVALTTVIAALFSGCSSASEYEPTVDDKDNYWIARAKSIGYEGDNALAKITPTLYDQGIESAMKTCDTIRGDREAAVLRFGITTAMYKDNNQPGSVEDEWRLAIRYLCPDAADAFAAMLEEAQGGR